MWKLLCCGKIVITVIMEVYYDIRDRRNGRIGYDERKMDIRDKKRRF